MYSIYFFQYFKKYITINYIVKYIKIENHYAKSTFRTDQATMFLFFCFSVRKRLFLDVVSLLVLHAVSF